MKFYTFSLLITLENLYRNGRIDTFKASFKTDFAAMSYKRLMRRFSTNIFAKCTWSKCKGLFIQKYYI